MAISRNRFQAIMKSKISSGDGVTRGELITSKSFGNFCSNRTYYVDHPINTI